MNDKYKYEVALSFLQEDEQLALGIADRVRGRVSVGVFVYSERQDELAGTDGVEKFSRVFAVESRIAIILYRAGWGATRWTRVEENAIKARGFNEGHEFVLLIKLDAATSPVWLPPTRIYLGFERYGIEGIASVVEARVQAVGGVVRAETVTDRAAAIGREVSFAGRRRDWLRSEEAAESAKQEADKLVLEVQKLAYGVKQNVGQLQVEFEKLGLGHCKVVIQRVSLVIEWYSTYANSLDRSGLSIRIHKGGIVRSGHVFKEPTVVEEDRYDIDLDATERLGWRKSKREKRFYTSLQLADFWLKRLLEEIRVASRAAFSRPAG